MGEGEGAAGSPPSAFASDDSPFTSPFLFASPNIEPVN